MEAMEKNNKTLNVPHLRFPEFSGEWEKTSIGDCCSDLEYGMNAASKNFDGVNKYIRITDIDELTSEYKQDSLVSPDALLEDKYLVKDGDILFARTGASTGKTYIYAPQDGKLYYAGFLIRANVNFGTNPKFVFYQTQTHRYKKWVSIMSMRSGQPGINSQEYASYQFWKPTKEEQDKISDLITLLDQRIKTQKKIIEDLKKLKRAIGKSIFTSPECVTRKMDDIATVTMGQSPSSHSYNDNQQGLPLIQGNLDLYDGRIKPRIYTSEITRTCKKGDVILTVRAPVGEIAHAQLTACIGRGVCTISPHSSSDAELIYQFLNYYKPTWSKLEQGSTFSSINGADIRDIVVRYPSMSNIKLLQSLDTRFQASVCLLNAYSVFKVCLLSQLFI